MQIPILLLNMEFGCDVNIPVTLGLGHILGISCALRVCVNDYARYSDSVTRVFKLQMLHLFHLLLFTISFDADRLPCS